MDPIRTAVKYSLIPLRAVVQLGEIFVDSGEEPPAPEPERTERRTPTRKTQQRRQAQKRAQPRKAAASPQASRMPKDLDDVGLARKVETVIFRDDSIPKGKIDVNAANGVVWLRGEATTPEMIKDLQRQTGAIPEVKQVENLLHLPNTPAATRTDTPASQRKTRSSTRRPTPEKTDQRGVTGERRSAGGEDLPVEAAHEGEGRKPAPLGANRTST
jgi:hypothetical protein